MRRPALAADLLAVDVGNTKFEAVLYERGDAAVRWRFDYGDGAGARLRRAAAGVFAAAPGVPVLVCSVAPARQRVLEAALARTKRRPLQRASWRSPWPFRIAVRSPSTLGADRLANVSGLCALGLRDGVAVDCGTAITIDLLRAGAFAGGLIVPGFDLALGALWRGTALLPRVPLRLPVPLWGDDTPSALRAGVYQVTRAGIAAVVDSLQEGRGSRLPVVVTGGAAEFLGDLGRAGTRHVPDLLFLGLRALAARLWSR